MSINSAMLSGVSGLIANSSALAAISDNIANVNTVAYKRNQVNFANVVTAQAVTGRYSAGGVQGVMRQFVAQQGLIQSATSSTDLAIAGDGFFVVTDKATNLTPADSRVFTRSGSFSVDANGYLVNDGKHYLQGWPVQANGTVLTNPSDLNQMQSINVKNLGAAVTPSSNAIINANLNKAQAVSASEATYVAAGPGFTAVSMADYANGVATGTQPDFTLEMKVIDSSGGPHRIALAFLKSATTNVWHAEMYSIPATDIDNGGGPPGLMAAGDVEFTTADQIDLAAAATTLFGPTAQFTLGPSSAGAGSVGSPNWAASVGVNGQTVTMDISKLTQHTSASTVNSVSTDGASVGNVIGVEVDERGFVSAIFDNSQVRQIAQIGLATFPNPDGLLAVSGNSYRATMGSGEFALKEPKLGGAGAISPSTLEASTVDLSAEFTGLITTQKAYSASSKIITTADQMMEELLSIKR